MAQASLITIDGPSGTGKGTISRLVAGRLGWHFLDSGSLYRLLALAAQTRAVALDNEDALITLAAHLDVEFVSKNNGMEEKVLFEGEDVTDTIRTEEIGNMASQVAAFPGVREALLLRQRAFKEPPGLVADGRDMGTVVFPEAEVKIFLTCSAEERARRRHKQLKEKGIDANLADLAKTIAERDARDMSRPVAPLKAAADAVVIDTTHLGIDEVVARVLHLVNKRMCA